MTSEASLFQLDPSTRLLRSHGTHWIVGQGAELLPEQKIDPCAWIERHVRLPGSARSEDYDFSATPWTREPAAAAATGESKRVTFVKPVQCGGSAAGEAVLCYWIATEQGGDVQYNWEDNDKAGHRWDTRFEKILLACKPLMSRAPSRSAQLGKWKRCQVVFPYLALTVQGAFAPKNLDSDTIRFQVNEELHNWEPGHLDKAYKRTTAVWNSVVFNISNAGRKNSQLHRAFLSGTQEHWEVPCPGCGKFHEMRTRFDPRRPDLGGLRYDADGCRTEDGGYDYNKLEKTIRYQFPCGHEIADDPVLRRQLSLGGRYGEPKNKGAKKTERSFTLDGVAVDFIPWLLLVQEKHAAWQALKWGDPEPWFKYMTERECLFVDPDEDRPVVGKVQVNLSLKKDRDGLPNAVARFGALDRQQGKVAKGEPPHWWAVIRDVDAQANSRLVYEGKVTTDEDAAGVMARHFVPPSYVLADSGDDTSHVYQFCLKHGFSAIKGSGEAYFSHGEEGRKIFSPEKPLWQMLNLPTPTRDDPAEEPEFFLYSKAGIRERLHWIRACTTWEVPSDVSDDYRAHMEAEEEVEDRHPKTGEVRRIFVQRKERNDLYVCECYIALQIDRSMLLAHVAEPPPSRGTLRL
jgi:hypothetical protein